MLIVVHALGQNRAEGDGGQGSGLLPHRPDLQKGPEGCGRGKRSHQARGRQFQHHGAPPGSRDIGHLPLPIGGPRISYVSKSEANRVT